MGLQQRTLKQYMELRAQPSLRAIAAETGINQARVFRILNGSRMKLDEWEVFNQIVEASLTDMEKLARDCLNELSLEQLAEVRFVMESKLQWKRTIDQAHSRQQRA